MSGLTPARLTAVTGVAAALLLAGSLPAMALGPSADPTTPPNPFTRVNVDTDLPGASFSAQGDVFGDAKPELVVSSYNKLIPTESGNKPAPAGRLQVYTMGADLTQWTKTQVFNESASIMFPNQVTIADVNKDGKNDLIVPGGYFFDLTQDNVSGVPNNRGTLTWWENKGANQPWQRHNLETASPASFHGVQYVDLDGDGVEDILTSAENGAVTSSFEDDVIDIRYYKGSFDEGTGVASFAAPITLATGKGGSSPQVGDVDDDGNLDIVISQFFGVFENESTYQWLERVGSTVDGKLSSANFVTHRMTPMTDTGRGFQMKLVPNLRGDGVDRWVGTNHELYPFSTDPSIPDGAMYELIPGEDVTQPWTAETLAGPISPRLRFGQGAPGVFGHGDLDGDGDTDFALSGDGDYRVFWVEQKANGTFDTHVLADYVAPAPGVTDTNPATRGFGQAGGALIMDLDGDGKNEIEFSSFDEHMVAIWTRSAPTTTTSKVTLTGGGATKAGASRTLAVRLTGPASGPATRNVKVTFKPNRTGVASTVATVKAAKTSTPGVFTASLKVTPKESGTYTASYTGGAVTPLHVTTSAAASAAVTSVSTVSGFPKKALVIKKYKNKKTAKKKAKLKYNVTVTPGFARSVVLQKRSCAPSKKSCAWKTVSTKKVASTNKVSFSATAPKGTSYWRVTSKATKSGTAVTSTSRKVTRR